MFAYNNVSTIIQYSVGGSCDTRGNKIKQLSLNSGEQCQDECKNSIEGCKYWEYYEDTKNCVTFDSDVIDCDSDVGPPTPTYDEAISIISSLS